MQIYIYTYINIYITYIYTLIYIFMLYLRTRESETRIERQGFKEKSLVLFFMYLHWPSARPSARSWGADRSTMRVAQAYSHVPSPQLTMVCISRMMESVASGEN